MANRTCYIIAGPNGSGKTTFATDETTLSGRAYAGTIKRIRDAGFVVTMFYLWIPSPELSIQRIKARVKQGGHDVPTRDVLRRFSRTQANLFTLYRPLIDNLYFFDNSAAKPRLVFTEIDGLVSIHDVQIYSTLTKEYPPCRKPEKK